MPPSHPEGGSFCVESSVETAGRYLSCFCFWAGLLLKLYMFCSAFVFVVGSVFVYAFVYGNHPVPSGTVRLP